MSPSPLRLLRTACVVALLGGLLTGMARAQDAAAIQRLLQGGQTAEASARLGEALKAQPRNPQLRFLKGVMLADAQQRDDAIETFRQLATDHPELPEPYNNLAVLYASQGDFERARGELEAALRASPGYAIAYQNLGDVYLQLARQAYQQALALDPANAGIPPRLALLRDLTQTKGAAAGAAR